jgi:hypothetical protein
MTTLPPDFERSQLANEPDYTGCREGEDFTMRIAENLPYQLGLTLEWIREHLGLRSEDISIADGVALRVIVSACVLQLKRGGEMGIRDKHMDIPFEATERWLHERFDADALTLMRVSGGDRDICREYLRRKIWDAEKM